jgi:hypothetical protein
MTNGVVSYEPTTFGELETFCKRITQTSMVPQAYRGKPDEAAATIMFGKEIGLPPMTSLQFVANINGRPGVYGDALPGIAMNKGLIKHMREWFEGTPYEDDYTAWCEVFRPDGSKAVQSFSVADAKLAKLWGKVGPWTQYPRRMLQWRARGWAIRDAAPNLLFGMTAEELQDIDTAEQHRGPDSARDITPPENAPGPRASADAALEAAEAMYASDLVDEDCVVQEGDRGAPDFVEYERPPRNGPDSDPLHLQGLSAKDAIGALEARLNQSDAAEGDRLLALYRDKLQKAAPNAYKALEGIVTAKIEQGALV